MYPKLCHVSKVSFVDNICGIYFDGWMDGWMDGYPVYRLLSLKQGLDVLVALFTTLLQVTLSNALLNCMNLNHP